MFCNILDIDAFKKPKIEMFLKVGRQTQLAFFYFEISNHVLKSLHGKEEIENAKRL